jgi:hypothetical protein
MLANATRRSLVVSRVLLGLLVLSLTVALAAEPKEPGPKTEAKNKQSLSEPPLAGAIEVVFTDDSILKLTLRDERIEVATRYGKLLIPVADIEKIDVGFRLPDDVARRVERAIADLGQTDFKKREAASATLLVLKEKAYPALLKAEKDSDMEVVRRVRDLLEKIREEVPAEHLEFLPDDVIYTEDSKFTGRITAAALKVSTAQFGEQQLKLTDVRSLRGQGMAEPVAKDALPDPGNLYSLQGQIGKTFAFTVTGGMVPGQGVPGGGFVIGPGGRAVGAVMMGGALWGTDMYTLDSSLAMAAVHAGVLKMGQTGVVRVTILPQQQAFRGSTRNGVTSMDYGLFPGAFKFVRGRARPGQ